jgi:hypothetical protein
MGIEQRAAIRTRENLPSMEDNVTKRRRRG